MALFENLLTDRGEDVVPEHLRGVRCEVTSCAYHDGERYCCADRITVGHSYAKNGEQTACATYKERSI